MIQRLVGWRVGVVAFAVAALLVFIFNLAVTAWAIAKHPPDGDGTGTIYEGPCPGVRSVNTGAHLLINILSIILLSGSNYCMQCLSAPTRADVDTAHAAGAWLDIGIPSFRNLRWISRERVALWCLLGLSSLPLHLFYNSSVFASISASAYNVTAVDERFLTNGPPKFYAGPMSNYNASVESYRLPEALLSHEFQSGIYREIQSNNLERLEPAACVDAYSQIFQSTWGDLVLVTESYTDSVYSSTPKATSSCGNQQSYEWICQQYKDMYSGDCLEPCDDLLSTVRANISNWQPLPGQSAVKYCLSRKTEEHCKLQFSTTISWLVVGLNLLKFALMCATAFKVNSTPLMTIGDAVSSFMRNPDLTTIDMCLASKNEFGGRWRLWSAYPRRFTPTPRRKFAAASKVRWIICISIYVAALALCCYLLGYGISTMRGRKDLHKLISLGLGTVTSRTIVASNLPSQGRAGLLSNVFLANVPQLILSTIYFTYNALFTCMSVASEWTSFSEHRKGLRVSNNPTHSQRTTYFLQLPYRLGVPLVFLSGVLHWLFSQSIFLVSVQMYHNSQPWVPDELYISDKFITCGWSPIAIICVIILGFCMVLWLLGTGSMKLRAGMPVAGSCSAAISAACHPGPEETDAWNMSLKWGDVNSYGGTVGHCSFSSRDVTFPKEGALYAGHA